MAIRSQEEALNAITAAGGRIEHAAARYSSGGAATKAVAARILAEAFAERATIYRQLPKLYRGRRPARWLAQISSADAALAMDMQAEEWRMRADRHDAEAARIERQALPAFTPSDHANRAAGQLIRAVTGESNQTERPWRVLSGGQEDGPRGPQTGVR